MRDVLDKVSSATNDSIDAGVVYTTDALTALDKVKIAYTPAYQPLLSDFLWLCCTQTNSKPRRS